MLDQPGMVWVSRSKVDMRTLQATFKTNNAFTECFRVAVFIVKCSCYILALLVRG